MLHLLVFLVAVGAALAHPSSRVHGGVSTPIEQRPFQVSLHKKDGRFFCGGSIVNSNHVLTAAHCINAELHYVRVGSAQPNEGGRIHYVNKTAKHERFFINEFKNAGYDVAVITVNSSFVYDKACQPVALFEKNEPSAPGKEAVVSGWGLLRNKTLPNELQSVGIPIVKTATCDVAYRPVNGLHAGEICAGVYGVGYKSPCQGDSGGPLTIAGRLAGIVSYAEGCGEPFYPAVFAEVGYFRDWIDKHLG